MKRHAPLFIVVVLALALSGCLNLTPGYGTISVESEPAGAQIFLDGQDTGKTTPATLERVRVGPHQVKVEIEGYASKTESVAVSRGKTVTVKFVLDPVEEPEPDPDAARIYGHVMENLSGTRLAGATVTAYEAGTGVAVASTVSDESGAFTLYVPAGTYDIVAEKAARAQGKRQGLTVGIAGEAEIQLISKKITDPVKKAVAPTIHVYLEVIDEDGFTVRVPFEPGTVVPQGLPALAVIVVEAEHDVMQTEVWIGHRDAASDWGAGLLVEEMTIVLWDSLDAPGDTELVVAVYDFQNNWTELRIPFTYEVGEPAVELHPVDVVELLAVTYGTDLELYRARRAHLYEQLGLPGDPDILVLGDGTVVDLARMTKSTTMYVTVGWTPVDGAVGYEIERAFHRNGPWKRIARVGPWFEQPYVDFGPDLEPGQPTYYRVRAIGPNGETGEWSAPTWVTPLDRLEIRLVEPADDATNVSLTPTFRWTYTDIAPQGVYTEYTFDIYVAGITGVPGGVSDYFAWFYEGLVNQSEAEYNFDGTGEPLLPGKTYEWNVVEGMAVAYYRLNSAAVSLAGTGLSDNNGYAGAVNGAFLFTTALEN